MEDSPPRRRLSSRPPPPPRDPASPRASRERPSASTQPAASHRPLRVQIPSNAPPVRRTATSATSPSIGSAPSPSLSSRSPSLPPALNPRTPRTPPSTSSPHAQSQSFSSAARHFPDLPSLTTTSPPRGITSPPQLAARPRRTSSIAGSSEASSSPSVASHSSKRKPPPPLALRRGQTWELEGGKGMARGDSSDSSEVEEADLWRADDGGNVGVLTPVSPRWVPPSQESPASSPGKGSKDEERDTLSGLYAFPSPLLDAVTSPTPSTFPPLALHPPGPDVDGDDEMGEDGPDEDDTAGTGFSFLSSPSSSVVSGTRSFSNGSEATDGSTSTGFGAGRQYTGLGLGLPFSMSAAANLSSLSTSISPPPSAHTLPSVQPFPRSPSGERSGPESPVTDRSKLIGLGELATPRWTSGVLERRWGATGEEKGEKPKGVEEDGDEFDVLGSYGADRESNSRPPTASGESPISSRPSSTRPPNGRQGSSNSSSNSYPSSAIHPTTLFPSTLAPVVPPTVAPSLTGPVDFSTHTPAFSPISPLDASQPSPVYSLDAVSINDNDLEDLTDQAQAQETLRTSQLAEEAPRRFEPSSKRRSMGAAASAPATATGSGWTGSRGEELSFDGAAEGNAALAAAAAALTPDSRRASVGATSASPSRRTSTGRTLSVDGKAPKSTHLRRQSASKSGFSHLPPSPIAPKTSFQPLAGTPLVPFQLPQLPLSPHAPNPTPTRPASTSAPATISAARTPDHVRTSRHSFHSHQSSPSLVAASILRQTRDLELEFKGVVDMDTLAAADTGTAEALRKLDGLSSPRLSKVYSGSPAVARSRTTSRDLGTPPAKGSRDSEDGKARRRARSSTGGSVALSKEVESAMQGDGSRSSLLSAVTMPVLSSAAGSPISLAFPSASGTPSSGATTVQMPRSPLSPPVQQLSRTPSSQVSPSYEVPFPTSSPFKQGSSSSASITAGTSTSATSRDSTSGTSLSGSSLATTAARSASSKNRRGSVGSDISSTHSVGEPPAARSDRADSRGEVEVSQFIPPVPPIPKDWESYRPSTAGTSGSSAQDSPRFNAERRPSDSSSFADSALLSPRAADMEPSWSAGSAGSSQGKTPTRKWSISFGKSKSPKPPSIKESSSYSDLLASNARNRNSSFSSHKSDPMGSRRMAASANDIAGLATGAVSRDSQESSSASTSSRIRSSFRSDKTASASSRPRTSSVSSNSTTTTSNAHMNTNPPPSVITTSPGRSRSSLLSPRRTPSGIPFFSRKSTGGSIVATPSPSQDKADSPGERNSGRKSILGLNFLRGSKKEKEKAPLPPPQPYLVRKTQSMVPPPKEVDTRIIDEFGRRASVVAKTSSMITRKRGKTLPGSMDEPIIDPKPLGLPPMQMAALSATTARRVDSLSSTASTSTLPSKNRTSTTSRQASSIGVSGPAAKLQESIKANLPTIAGSPSTHTFPLVQDRQFADSTRAISPPKSLTPTKIPRLYQRAAATSPRRLTPRASDSSLNRTTSPSTSGATNRRFSQYGSDTSATRLSSSVSSSQISPSFMAPSENDSFSGDFGVTREPGLVIGEKTLSTRRRLDSEPTQSQIPSSRSSSTNTTNSLASSRPQREPLDTSTPVLSSRAGTALPRIPRRQSLLASDSSKAALAGAITPRTTGVAATPRKVLSGARPMPTAAPEVTATSTFSSARRPVSKVLDTPSSSRRASAASTADSLASSRSSRSIVSKVPSWISVSSTTSSLNPAPSTDSGRSSTNSNYGVSAEELRGDEEMSAYVRRQQAKKLASGVSADVIRKMFEFPDPTKPLPPLDCRDALSLYSRYLSDYEKEEIREHEKVYFVGPNSEKKPATKDHPTNNFGFDDERGDYLLVPHDHILYRYEAIDVLGKGSFGQVLQCRDHKTGEMVAIKIIRNKKRFHHQALVEIKVLENLVNWDPDEKHFVIRMVDSFTFRGHLCIVTELLSINLYELVKANSFAGFTTTLIRRFTIQILGSLSLLRHHRVVHCDLKPENILLKHPAKSAIKVIDFGSSCFENEKVYTYIQSRFYRSPEVILGMNYHMAIDMWSLGCIIAEMYTGYPIFPGENEQEQLACIMEVMGLPDKYLVDRSSRKRLFFDSTGAPRPVVNSKGRRRRPGSKTLAQVLKSDDDLFVDFISKCLTWDPDRRLKPDPALRHPWIVAARQRAVSPSTIPARIGRSSLGTSTMSSASSSISSASQISTPRRKVGTSTANSTPAHSHHSSSNVSATAPVERTRTASTTASGPPPRLTSKGSLGLPASSSRYFIAGKSS